MQTQAVLTGNDAEQAVERALELLQVLIELPAEDVSSPSVAEGAAGFCLFESECERLGFASGPTRWAQRALETFNPSQAGASLHRGAAGLSFALQHSLLDASGRVEPIDQAITDALARNSPEVQTAGLTQGLAGILLGACAASGSRELKAQCVRRLVSLAEQNAEGETSWRVPPDLVRRCGLKPDAQNLHDAGAAHGISSIALALACAAWAGVEEGLARPKALGALKWLRSHARLGENHWGLPLHDDPTADPRFSETWCCGDPGVLFVAHGAALALGDLDHSTYFLGCARGLAERALKDWRPGLPNRFDLCCGLAGGAHIFTEFYRRSGDVLFLSAARHLWRNVLRSPLLTDSPSGLTLLHGEPGVALALLSATRVERSGWDVMFANLPIRIE